MVSTKRKFNWIGITDNGDGTFIADDKRARTRLLKEFHRQGVKVRSSKSEYGWKVETIGSLERKRYGTSPALRSYPARRSSMGYGRPRIIQQRRQYPYRRPYPIRRYSNAPRARGLGLGTKASRYIHEHHRKKMARLEQERRARIEGRKTEQEITAKQRSERIQAERAETQRQLEKRRLERVRLNEIRKAQAKEREGQNEMRKKELLARAQEKHENLRKKQERHTEFEANRQHEQKRQEWRRGMEREMEREKKPTPAEIQSAREAYVQDNI